VPTGQGKAQRRAPLRRPATAGGRTSKPLTYDQADALLAAAEGRSLHGYIVVSLLTGARTEELRALTWSHVDLGATPHVIRVLAFCPRWRRHQDQEVPPHA
jgi:integrase